MRRHVVPTLPASTINRLAWLVLAVLLAAATARAGALPTVEENTTVSGPVKQAPGVRPARVPFVAGRAS